MLVRGYYFDWFKESIPNCTVGSISGFIVAEGEVCEMVLVFSRFVVGRGFAVRVWEVESGHVVLQCDAVDAAIVAAIGECVRRQYFDRPVYFIEASSDQLRIAGE